MNYTWSADGRTGVNYTDDNGFFEIPFNISAADNLGDFTLQFEFLQDSIAEGQYNDSASMGGFKDLSLNRFNQFQYPQSGDIWDFTAQVTDDNTTSVRDSGGSALDGAVAPNGGLVDVIFEGVDFSGVTHRQIVATVRPSAELSLYQTLQQTPRICVIMTEMVTDLLTETSIKTVFWTDLNQVEHSTARPVASRQIFHLSMQKPEKRPRILLTGWIRAGERHPTI